MSKASSVVASVTQQSRQRVPQSQTEYRERPKATNARVMSLRIFLNSRIFTNFKTANDC